MDKKSNLLLLTLIVLTVVSVSVTYYKTFVLRDFKIVEEEVVGDIPEGTEEIEVE
jgi:cell division protein FtsL